MGDNYPHSSSEWSITRKHWSLLSFWLNIFFTTSHNSGLCSVYVPHRGCNVSLGAVRTIRPGHAPIPADVAGQEGTDWLQLLWNFVTSLVAPDEEEEGIHLLTETLTCKGAPHPHHPSPFHTDPDKRDAKPARLPLPTFMLHDWNVNVQKQQHRSNLSANILFQQLN